MRKKKVLFVCTGNTCRSPLAEVLLQQKADVEVQSAGVHAAPHMPASQGTNAVLTEKGISHEHYSQMISAQLLQWADIVLTMTESHKNLITSAFPQSEHIFTLKEFAGASADNLDISDPFGGPVEVYRETAEEIEHYLDEIIHKIIEK